MSDGTRWQALAVCTGIESASRISAGHAANLLPHDPRDVTQPERKSQATERNRLIAMRVPSSHHH